MYVYARGEVCNCVCVFEVVLNTVPPHIVIGIVFPIFPIPKSPYAKYVPIPR